MEYVIWLIQYIKVLTIYINRYFVKLITVLKIIIGVYWVKVKVPNILIGWA